MTIGSEVFDPLDPIRTPYASSQKERPLAL